MTAACSPSELPRDSGPAAPPPSREPVAPKAPPAAPVDWNGVYSSANYNEEGGDMLGMEVEVRTQPEPTVIFTLCEGECRGGKTWPAVIDGSQVRFSTTEQLTDQDGKPVEPLTLNFVGRLEGDVLTVRQADAAADVPEEKLTRVARPEPGQTARLGCGATAC